MPRIASGKAASQFAHLQAVLESGGQFSVDGSPRGFVTAFAATQLLQSLRYDPEEAIWPLLRRVDNAIATVQATGKCIDESDGQRVIPAPALNEVANLPSRRFSQIQALLAWGGNIALGCRPGAACASQNHRLWVVLAKRPAESIEDLLRRLDWSIGMAQSTRRCIDEVFSPITPQPIRECPNHGSQASKPHAQADQHRPVPSDHRRVSLPESDHQSSSVRLAGRFLSASLLGTPAGRAGNGI